MSQFQFQTTARTERVEPSATLAISNRAAELEAQGVDVADLSVGEPDFPTPDHIVQAGKEALDAGHTTYTSSNGVPALKQAIATELRTRGIDAAGEEVIVTPGGKQALYEAVVSLIDPGDEVVLLDPAWVSYEPMVKLADGETTHVPLDPPTFELASGLDRLESAVTDETALLVVNTPNNPTGAVYDEDALAAVRDLAVTHDVACIADEIYDQVTYGVEQTSLASLDGMGERTVTINGFSKAYAMTGWRLGYLHAKPDLIAAAGKVQSHTVSCATNFVQRAGIEALQGPSEPIEEMVAAFHDRRDMLIDLFGDHGLDVAAPDGAFYMMLPVADDDTAWCEQAINDAHVAAVPGSAFGADGYARISYAASADRLREAVDRLTDAGLL